VDSALAEKISLEAFEIMAKASASSFIFFNGKSSKNILGGLFYLLGLRFVCVKTQKEIAVQLGTTDVTIRVSYRDWLKAFPELFRDVSSDFGDEKHGYNHFLGGNTHSFQDE
jgi:transcription initiation factor TFIIIB Brf1 subunit/transcription initiation factor TFIIB